MMKYLTLLIACLFSYVTSFSQNQYEVVSNEPATSVISFKKGTADLLPGSLPRLQELRSYLSEHKEVTLMRIEAHVAEGDHAQALSEAQAMSVARWLVANGIDCKRLLPVGFGNTKPILVLGDPRNARISLVTVERSHQRIASLPQTAGGKAAGDPCRQ